MANTNVKVNVNIKLGDSIRSLRRLREDDDDIVDRLIPKKLQRKKNIYVRNLWEMSPS